jgi:putative spermidine/putrescine transport system permease protein
VSESRPVRIALAAFAALLIAFLFIPIVIIIVYAFNKSNVQGWPIDSLSTKWFSRTFQNEEMRAALWLSVKAAVLATTIALLLGTSAAFALHRFRFFGREAVSLLLVLPIALPGIITGMSLNSFFQFWKIDLSYWTIVIGHATFCIVIIFNNVIARLRQTQSSLIEASMDLGADGWQTFRHITMPVLSSAAACWPLRSPSTRSSSPRSRPGPRTPCPSGSSGTSGSASSCRRSTWPSCWCWPSPSSRSSWPSG